MHVIYYYVLTVYKYMCTKYILYNIYIHVCVRVDDIKYILDIDYIIIRRFRMHLFIYRNLI